MSLSTDSRPVPDSPAVLGGAHPAATRLRNVLRLNAGFSALTGVSALVATGPVSRLLGVDQAWAVRSLGAGLVAFAAVVLVVAAAPVTALARRGLTVSLADLGWVAATVVVIPLGWFSTRGAVVMGLLGLVVLDLAVAQLRARGRLVTAP